MNDEGFSSLQFALALAGSLLLGVGIFQPFVEAPNVGDLSALMLGNGGLLLIFALGALLLTLTRSYDAAAILGACSLVALGLAYLRLRVNLAHMANDMSIEAGSPQVMADQ